LKARDGSFGDYLPDKTKSEKCCSTTNEHEWAQIKAQNEALLELFAMDMKW
jgi:hypothetical protein